MTALLGEVRRVGHLAMDAARGTVVEAEVADLLRSLDEPLRVAVAGRVKAGKSTLLNALVGQELAATDAGECTRIVTWYRNGLTYRVEATLENGSNRSVPFRREHGALQLDLDELDPADVAALNVECPSARLAEVTLVDTPGIGAIGGVGTRRSEDFLAGEHRPTAVDAVIYLTRHLHRDDVAFLEGFHDDEVSQPVPVNTVGVLSRADEIGVARLDAMDSAARIAARYSADPAVRRLCQSVLPVAGLLAQAGATLREDEFSAFNVLASMGDDVDDLLRSVDRFRAPDAPIGLSATERSRLLDRFGLFGVRLSVHLIRRRSVESSTQLAIALVDSSGITELRSMLTSQFARRRDVLKARSGLRRLDQLGVLLPEQGAKAIAEAVERIEGGAHELAELRLVNALRAGAIDIDDPDEAERILGGSGAESTARLGLDRDADADLVSQAVTETLARYQSLAEHPLSSPARREAARAVVRTCEGLVAELSPDDATENLQ